MQPILEFLNGGLLNWPLGYAALFVLATTHVTIVAVTVFLHRHQAHRALDLHSAASHFFRFWLWLTTGMVTKAWVAIHRKHHARCETDEDPHSPQVMGINTVLWRGAELYRREARKSATLDQYGRGTPDDWLERHLYTPYNYFGIVLLIAIDVILFGAVGITLWAIQMIWIPFWAAGVINGLGHWWGYRNYETLDASTNICPWGILIGGEELHNNHHTFSSSAKLSSKWWEFDIGWMYIRILEFFGLAKVRKVASRPVIDPRKHVPDEDTLGAIIKHRFQVMSYYYRDVLVAVCRDVVRSARKEERPVLRKAVRLLAKEERGMDAKARGRLEFLLRKSSALNTAYRFKLQLQDIWKKSAASQESLLHALQEWCRQAEATGIAALQEFARSLKGYSLRSNA